MKNTSLIAVLATLLATSQVARSQPVAGGSCSPNSTGPATPCSGPAGNGTLQCKPSFPPNGTYTLVCLPSPYAGPTTIHPKYLVLSVIYSPPGAAAKGTMSTVEYGLGSSTGASTTVAESFSKDLTVSAVLGFDTDGKTGSAGGGVTYSKSKEDTRSLDVTKENTRKLTVYGPATDGINHDEDVIVLWLNPDVDVVPKQNSVAWTFTGGGTAITLQVAVGYLKLKKPLPAGMARTLNDAGITPADYPDILSYDHFAYASSTIDRATIDPDRFVLTTNSFTYEQGYDGDDHPSTTSHDYTSTTAQASTHTSSETHKVSLNTSVPLGLVTLKTEGSWEWTASSSAESRTSGSETASVMVGGPSPGYEGPPVALVYFDTVYKTFLFSLIDKAHLRGHVTRPGGNPASDQEVTAKAGGVVYRTYTSPRGQYSFPQDMQGPIELRSGSLTRTLSGASLDADLAPPRAPRPRPPGDGKHPVKTQ